MTIRWCFFFRFCFYHRRRQAEQEEELLRKEKVKWVSGHSDFCCNHTEALHLRTSSTTWLFGHCRQAHHRMTHVFHTCRQSISLCTDCTQHPAPCYACHLIKIAERGRLIDWTYAHDASCASTDASVAATLLEFELKYEMLAQTGGSENVCVCSAGYNAIQRYKKECCLIFFAQLLYCMLH